MGKHKKGNSRAFSNPLYHHPDKTAVEMTEERKSFIKRMEGWKPSSVTDDICTQ